MRAGVAAVSAAVTSSLHGALNRFGFPVTELVASAEQAEATILAQRVAENTPIFNEQARLLTAMLNSICVEERAAWDCDQALALAFRIRCGLGRSDACGWCYENSVLDIHFPAARRNDDLLVEANE